MKMPMRHKDYSIWETAPHVGGGITGDKLTTTYDLVDQMQYLYVRVVKANDLPPKDVTGSYDPYVEVKLGTYKGTNRHFEKKANLEWNQVFSFSKDRIQATNLEVVVKDNDFVKDGFIGRVQYDLNEVSSLILMRFRNGFHWIARWHCSSIDWRIRRGIKTNRELMLAVWMGTPVDEAFPDDWHSDAATLPSDGRANIRSKVNFVLVSSKKRPNIADMPMVGTNVSSHGIQTLYSSNAGPNHVLVADLNAASMFGFVTKCFSGVSRIFLLLKFYFLIIVT